MKSSKVVLFNMPLLKHIKSSDNRQPVIISAHHIMQAEDIINYKNQHSTFLSSLKRKKIAIQLNSNWKLSFWLILLDGLASRVTIIPPCVDATRLKDILSLSRSDIVLSDTPETDNKLFINIDKLKPTNQLELDYDLSTEWVIATSGTTGTPKLVRHNIRSLTNTVKVNSDIQKKFTWGLLYNLHRFAGIQVFLQSVVSGSSLVITENDDNLVDKIKLFLTHSVNCLSATPTLWRKLLMLPESNLLNLKNITLGGEIADQSILNALKNQYPNAKIRHIYASTEAGVAFSITDGKAGFPATFLTDNEQNIDLKISKSGTLMIRSQSHATGYLGGHQFPKTEDGYIDTGDLVSLNDSRYLFQGRENGAINVGGNKVQPELIEQTLMDFPGILLASVKAKKSSITGHLVSADIVLSMPINDQKRFIKDLKEYCRSRLAAYMVPAIIKIVDDISLNSTGKLCRT